MKKILSLMTIASVLCLQAYSDGIGPYNKQIRPSRSQAPGPRVQPKAPSTAPSRPTTQERPQVEQTEANKPNQ